MHAKYNVYLLAEVAAAFASHVAAEAARGVSVQEATNNVVQAGLSAVLGGSQGGGQKKAAKKRTK